jgi:hypothetical protein
MGIAARFGMRRLLIGIGTLVLLLVAIPVGCGWFGPRTPADQADLLRMIAAARDSIDAPGRTVTAAAPTLATPEAALAFVRDRVALADYRYRRLDPDVALKFRTANAIDKAALLAALIEKQGYRVEIRYADWPKDAEPIRATGLEVPQPVRELLAAIDADGDRSGAEAGKRSVALRDRVDRAAARVEPLLISPPTVFARPLPRYRYWVRARKDDGDWQAFDPVFADQPTDAGYSVSLDPVVPVRIELFAENRGGTRVSLLKWQGPITGDMSLSYLPTNGAAAYLSGKGRIEDVKLWTPILAVGGKAIAGKSFTNDGSVPELEKDGSPLIASTDAAPVPAIAALKIDAIDTSDYPQIVAQVSANVATKTVWRSHFLQLRDNGDPAPVRILGQPASLYGGRTVMFVIDNSGSMAAHLPRVRELMFALIDRLGPGVRVGMTHINAAERLVVPPQPLTDRQAMKAQVDNVLQPGSGNRELEAMETALRAISTPVDFVLVGDGELRAPDDAARIRALVEGRGSRIYSILVAGKPDLYRQFAASVWTALPGQLPDTLSATLAGSFADSMRIAWTARGERDAEHRVSLASPGWRGGPATAAYRAQVADQQAIVAASPLGPGLILSIDTAAYGDTPQLRRIVALDGPRSAPALTSITRIGFVPGIAPDEAVLAAQLDLWHAIGTARRNGAKAPLPFRDGPGALALARGNALLRGAIAAYGDALIQDRPLVLLEHASLVVDGNGEGRLRRTLDLFNSQSLRPRADEKKPWRIGLAIAAGEGVALGVDGIDPAMIDGGDLRVFRRPDALPAPFANIAEARGLFAAGPAMLLAGSGNAPRGWVVRGGGLLESRLFDPGAKGANAEKAIADFKKLKASLTRGGIAMSGLATPYGVPGAPLGGVVGILEANRKMWCYSSVMMGFVADDIAGRNFAGETDPVQWQQRAGKECEIKPDNFARELALNVAVGAISNQITDNIGTATGIAYEQWALQGLHPVAAGLLGGGLSAGFEYGGVNQALSDALQ